MSPDRRESHDLTRRPGTTGPARRPPRLRVDRRRLRRAGLLVPEEARAPVGEEIRGLRAALLADLRRAVDPAARAVLVTSARPGEGKTFVTANLALSLAADPELRVVLIDADGVRRGLSEAFGLAEAPGLADLLTDGAKDVARAFHRTDIGHLVVVPAGHAGSGLPEYLASRRMARIFQALLADPSTLVLLDTPPVLAGSEALALVPQVGRVLFVIEAGRTPRADVEEALRPLVRQSEVRIVLNKAAPGAARRYAYGPPAGRRLRSWVLAALLLLGGAVPGLARTEFTPRVETTVAVSDNVEAAPEDEARGGLLSRIALGARLERLGRRLRLWLDGTLVQTLARADGRLAELSEQLEGALRLELWRRLLFFEVRGEVDEEVVAEERPLAVPEFSLAQGRTRRASLDLGPELRARVGRLAVMELGWRYARTEYGDGARADSSGRELRAVLRDRPGGRIDWSVTAVETRESLDPTRTAPARRRRERLFDGEVAVELVEGLVLLAGAGFADRRDETRRDRFAAGIAWRAGVRARIDPRVRLDAAYGRRAGDPDGRATLTVRLGPRTGLALTYRERILNRAVLAREGLPTVEPVVSSGTAPELAEPVPLPGLPTVVGTDASFRSRYGELALERTGARDRWRLLVWLERRTFSAAAFEDQWRFGAEFAWVRRLHRRADLQLEVSLSRIRFDGGDRLDDLSLAAGWVYHLSRRTRLGLGVEHTQRVARGRSEDVRANMVFVRLARTF